MLYVHLVACIIQLVGTLLWPSWNPLAFGLAGNGVWLPGRRGGDWPRHATFRFVVDVPEPTGPMPLADAAPAPAARSADVQARQLALSEPIKLVPVAETEVSFVAISRLVTPMDLPRELDLQHILDGPKSSAGPAHPRGPCAFCSGSGCMPDGAVPKLLRCALTKELMTDPVVIAGDTAGGTYERAAIEAHSKYGVHPLSGAPLRTPLVLQPNEALREACALFRQRQSAFERDLAEASRARTLSESS